MRKIILCADDYGYNQPISAGIIELIKKQRLTATSCMTNMAHWPVAAKALNELKNQVDVGLHFNLTEGSALKHPSLFCKNNRLIVRAFLQKIDPQQVKDELLAQIEAFEKHLGKLPDFIDGHQHIHHLPVIRKALLDVYQTVYPDKRAYIRVSANPLVKTIKQSLRCPKILVIALTGAYSLKKQLEKLGIPHNDFFSGIYDLSSDRDYAVLFQRFLNDVKDGGLVMCHPGLQSDDCNDEIRATRFNEYQYLLASN